MLSFEAILLIASLLVLLSIVASKASGKLGVPALVLFLLIGMLAGSDGPGGIYFDDARLAQSLGIVALALILFSGGMGTDWGHIRPVLASGLALATIGVFLTALLVGVLAAGALGFTLLEGLLLGAIVSSTDAAAVFAVLRSRGAQLKGQIGPLIELESGSNDPMAVFLTASLTGLLLTPDMPLTHLIVAFGLQMVVGAVFGVVSGLLMTLAINRLRLEYEGLYPVLTLALALLTYGGTALAGGNGFLAVYLAGIVLGNRPFVHKRSLTRFHDGVAWLMQIAMFLTLGLLVFPSQLPPIVDNGLIVSAFLIFVARPVAVFVTLLFAHFTFREKLMISWVGLRGAVPIILATFPLIAGLPKAETIFNLVFFVVLTSVLLQGTTIPFVARWLGLMAEKSTPYRYPLEYIPKITSDSQLTCFEVHRESRAVGQPLMEIGLPAGALAVLIQRETGDIVPNGGTVIEAGDRLLILTDPQLGLELPQLIEARAVQLRAEEDALNGR
jgi:cell volume regulation protein A